MLLLTKYCCADKDIFIGIITRSKLATLLNDGDVSETEVNLFFKAVRSFYMAAMDYALKNLPIKDELLINAQFLDFNSRISATLSQVEYFVQRWL